MFQEVSPEGILEYFRKNDVILYETVVRHADTYGWMSNYNWDQRVSTPTDYIRNVASLVDSDADAALTEIEENYRALEVKYLAFADTLKSDEVVSLCDLVRRFVNRKLENWEAIAMAGNNALPLFHDVCRRLGISIEQFFLLSGPEIQKSLKTSMDDTEAVNSPKRGILIVEKKVSILKYEEAVELKKALLNVVDNFSEADAEKIKLIEATTNHDVKAVEYFLKEVLDHNKASELKEWIHFGLTSQDINNTAIPLSWKEAMENNILPAYINLQNNLYQLAKKWKKVFIIF